MSFQLCGATPTAIIQRVVGASTQSLEERHLPKAMTTHHNKRLKATLWLVALIYPVAWLVSELRWAHVNDPMDRFTNVTRYLAGSRQPSRVTRVRLEEKTYYIAYSPTDFWLATPSSPAAYVFDDRGQMIEWSADPGDDLAFQSKWSLPQHNVATSELSQLGAEQ